MKGAPWHVEHDIGEPPCQGCPNVRVCRLGFACVRFRAWSISGVDDVALPRVPMRAIYRKLYPLDVAPFVDALLGAA